MTRPVPVAAHDVVPAWARPLPYSVRRVWDPATYQGGSRTDNYFEGWYVKAVDAAGSTPIAFIPGVSRDASGNTSHSFVQVVRPGGTTAYVRYPAEEFSAAHRGFDVRVGPNRFSAKGLAVDLEHEALCVKGELEFSAWTPWPVRALSPGVMGWYRFVPRMECYHGVCSLDHGVDGSLTLDGTTVGFDAGRGYVEKDWGRSFPSSWVWAQSNHFTRQHTSATVSVARIPWMRSSFVGFIAGVLLDGELYRFTTYTGARLSAFQSRFEGALMRFEDADYVLDVELEGALPAPLLAPRHGKMVARADESLSAEMVVHLIRKRDGAVLLDDCGLHAGCEIMDAHGELCAGVRP